jgi:predicted GNAT family acetyltransferase
MSDETSSGVDDGAVIDNSALQRFELQVGDQVAFAEYRLRPGLLIITHVETPPSLRGGGIAARVMKGVLDHARQDGIKVLPLCAYAEAYLQRHPEYRNLVS